MSTIDSIIATAPFFQEASLLDMAVTIADTEGTVIYRLNPKTFKTDLKVGDKISAKGAGAECLRTKEVVRRTLPKEMYGFATKGISMPIFEGGQLAGALLISTSIETQQVLNESASSIATIAEQLSASAEELAATASQLAQDLADMKNRGERILNEISKTDDILQFIRDVSANSNLLGLNAAIEAARAGEQGRGFAVVAEEIRKMAVNSSKAVTDIKDILDAIRAENEYTVNNMAATAQLGERQAAATEEISASMEQLASSATDIKRISNEL